MTDNLSAEAESAFAEYEGITAKELAETVARYGAALSGIAQKTLPATDYQQMARDALRGVTYSAPDHYYAVDYTGCIHEAPDRETAIKWAEDFARTANGGAIGSERPEVAKTIGQMIEASKARVAAMTPAEREEMYRQQRESFVRGMRPCEHGVADWEDCPKCKDLAQQAALSRREQSDELSARWRGPFKSAAEALDETRRACADLIGADPETWPSHGNAPLAITASLALARRTAAPSEPEPVVAPAAGRDAVIEEISEQEPVAVSLARQVKADLAAAHEEICKLQGLDPKTHSWPAWSSPAHTIAWCDRIIAGAPSTLPAPAALKETR